MRLRPELAEAQAVMDRLRLRADEAWRAVDAHTWDGNDQRIRAATVASARYQGAWEVVDALGGFEELQEWMDGLKEESGEDERDGE